MRPIFSPFRKTLAFQLMPLKFNQTCFPVALGGATNSSRYQKSA